MLLKTELKLNFIHNYPFLTSQGTLKKKIIFLKSLIFFFLILNFYFKKKFAITLKKKKMGSFNIFKAPYKNKLAQRKYYIKRFFFYVKLDLNRKKIDSKNLFINNLKAINMLGNNFFYLKMVNLSFFI